MVNLYLDPDSNDIEVKDFNPRLTQNNVEWVAQTIQNRLSTFLGEWYLNRNIGLPYFERILQKQSDITDINGLFLAEINAISLIDKVESFETTYDTTTRLFLVGFTVRVNGESITNEVNV